MACSEPIPALMLLTVQAILRALGPGAAVVYSGKAPCKVCAARGAPTRVQERAP